MDRKVYDRLEKILNTDPGHQAKVEARKAELRKQEGFDGSPSGRFPDYAALRHEKARIEAALSDCQVRLDAAQQLLIGALADAKLTGLTAANGEKFRIEPALSVSFPDPAAFREWCLDDDDLVLSMALHPSKAISVVKKRLEAGEEDPPGVSVKFWDKPVYTPLVPLKKRAKKGGPDDGSGEGGGSEGSDEGAGGEGGGSAGLDLL